MGIRRHNARRDANEGVIVAAFEAMGCLVRRIDTPADLLVNHHGTVLLVEVKTRTGRLTDDQRAFAEHWPLHIVKSPEEAIALVQRRGP
ncbi:MAG TPA: hypothetical protein VK196_17085 [Magnetospirillum sp.]|nr:hypothetical protein [Magnetospirillum sp.]